MKQRLVSTDPAKSFAKAEECIVSVRTGAETAAASPEGSLLCLSSKKFNNF